MKESANKATLSAKPRFSGVDHYIAAQPKEARPVLEEVRRVIRRAVPKAEEVISYNMPTFQLDGVVVLHLAGWKKHYSLYPCARHLVEAFKHELTPYEVSNKGTVRFPLAGPVPLKLIDGMAKYRAAEIRRRAKPRDRKE